MTEDEARQWIIERFGVSRETMLQRLIELVLDESARQNLVSRASAEMFWRRHIVDSAQLLNLADNVRGHWLDIGTGAGFPGLVIACLRPDAPITLCEPRKRRAAFLASAVETLGLFWAQVADSKVESIRTHAAIVSARAVAPLPALFAAAAHVATRETLWLLPKGRSAREEVVAARRTWHGSFHVERSVTQSDSAIVVAKGVIAK